MSGEQSRPPAIEQKPENESRLKVREVADNLAPTAAAISKAAGQTGPLPRSASTDFGPRNDVYGRPVGSGDTLKPNIDAIGSVYGRPVGSDDALQPSNNAVGKYLAAAKIAEASYSELSALERVRVTDFFTLSTYTGCLVGFVSWWFLMPPLRLAELFVGSAWAADVASGDPKNIIFWGIFGVLFATLIVSIYVTYFGKDARAADAASGTSKMLLGFFIGAGSKYLGLT